VTQQNSALVEENAATAKTLEQQAEAMNERISFFHVGQAQAAAMPGGRSAPAPRPHTAVKRPATTPPKRPAAAPNRGPVGRMQTALAGAIKSDPDWQEF
jgi:methyl-accepting chemotaxis protein